MRCKITLLTCSVFIMFGCASTEHKSIGSEFQSGISRPWQELTRADLEMIYQVIRADHPGPMDKENPQFNQWLEKGYKETLTLIPSITNFDGYKFALYRFVEGFNDGHLNFNVKYRPNFAQWPGFTLTYRERKPVVHNSTFSNNEKGPVAGQELLDCDGKALSVLLEENIYPYEGMPEPQSKLYRLVPLLMVDMSNPFIKRPKACRFKDEKRTYAYSLKWDFISKKTFDEKITSATFGKSQQFLIKEFSPGKFWISIPTFGPMDNQLEKMKEIIKRLRPLSKSAKLLVLDVRGNSGGSSQWGEMIFESLYGPENLKAVKTKTHGKVSIDWRVSKRNLELVEKWPMIFAEQFGPKAELVEWAQGLGERIRKGYESGVVFVKQDEKNDLPAYLPDFNYKIGYSNLLYFLTDAQCGSACLDFADLIIAMPNTVHVGLETYADTVYMEGNFIESLPSGLSSLSYPMKVWRNRIRGNRESYKPKHEWLGDFSNSKALEKWILFLHKKTTH